MKKWLIKKFPFLDTDIFIDENDIIQLKFYKKPTASDVKLNFRHAVTPMKYKISTLVGEIYRAARCTTTIPEREKALSDVTETFTRNGYPPNLIRKKINEIRSKNFESTRKKDSETEKDSDQKSYNLTIPYTSSRCDKIIRKTINMIKNITPEFKINLTWKTVKIRSAITPKLKKYIPPLEKSGLVYKFTCDCSETYVGETKRSLKKRISEHNWKSKQTAVYQHTSQCTFFNNALSQKIGEEPTSDSKNKKLNTKN